MGVLLNFNREREIAEDIEAIREIVDRHPDTVRFINDCLDAAEDNDNEQG